MRDLKKVIIFSVDKSINMNIIVESKGISSKSYMVEFKASEF
jgi:hypothetical protein